MCKISLLEIILVVITETTIRKINILCFSNGETLNIGIVIIISISLKIIDTLNPYKYNIIHLLY